MAIIDDIKIGGEEQSGAPVRFAPGNVVRLKTGGPAMAVDGPIRTDGIVPTMWFDGAILHRDAFEPCCLVLVAG